MVSVYCAFIYYINIVFKGFPINPINPNLWVDKVRFFLKLAQKAETERNFKIALPL